MEEIRAYIGRINDANPDNKELFCELFSEGMRLLLLTNEDFSDQFKVSRPTVIRWRTGQNAPLRFMREQVYKWLTKRGNKFLLMGLDNYNDKERDFNFIVDLIEKDWENL